MLRLRSCSPIGLDAGARCVKAVQIERTRSSMRVVAAASVPRLHPGVPFDKPEARRVFDVLWRRGFSGREVVLAVPGDKLLAGVMELPPRASGAPLRDIARQELARSCKCEPALMEMHCWELPGGARASEGAHVMAVGCKHADANEFLDQFESAGARVVALDAASPAIARACAPKAAPNPALTAVLDLGWTAAQLLVLQGPVVVYERSVKEHGLGTLTAAVKSKLKVDPEAAQLVIDKLGCLAVAPDELADWELSDPARALVGAHIDAIAGELRLALAYAERRFGAMPGALLLSGGGCLVPGLAERLGERAGLAPTILRLGDLFPVAPGLESVDAHTPLVLALGLALHDRAEEQP